MPEKMIWHSFPVYEHLWHYRPMNKVMDYLLPYSVTENIKKKICFPFQSITDLNTYGFNIIITNNSSMIMTVTVTNTIIIMTINTGIFG